MSYTRSEQETTMIHNGSSEWKIVVADHAIPSEKHAAEELSRFLENICGVRLPIVSDQVRSSPYEIVVGFNKRIEDIGWCPDIDRLGQEGFVIKTTRDRLIIAGGKPRGTLYGVYTFLEDVLGCRWLTSKVSHIPNVSVVKLPELDMEKIPVLATRTALFKDTYDGDWAARNKINCWPPYRLEEKHGGKLGMSRHFVHTFYELVPPDQYFDTNPEYFSLVQGERKRSDGQLCLTNPEVFHIALRQLKRWLKEEPNATIFGVSQNDWTGACECDQCLAIDEKEESPIGSILYFVNRLAESIEEDYPDKKIETLAYWYSRKPPKHTKPRSNVIIRLCSIECCFLHPLDECEKNKSFVQDIIGWGKMSDQVYIWDYVVDFHHYLMPFPNLRVLQSNIRFFIRNSTLGIMAQGAHTAFGTEFAELKAYVIAKLLWDPDLDLNRLIDEFLHLYYGNSADSIKAYIQLLERQVDALEDFHMGCFAPPHPSYFTPELLDQADALLAAALELADDDQIRERVAVVAMQIKYVRMILLNEQVKAMRSSFLDEAAKLGITRITELRPLAESLNRMEAGLSVV